MMDIAVLQVIFASLLFLAAILFDALKNTFPKDKHFQHRVGCQPVCSVRSRSGALSGGKKTAYRSLPPAISAYAANHIMRCRRYGYQAAGYIQPPVGTELIDMREARLDAVGSQMRNIKKNIILLCFFHIT